MTEFGLLKRKGIIAFTDGIRTSTRSRSDVENNEFC